MKITKEDVAQARLRLELMRLQVLLIEDEKNHLLAQYLNEIISERTKSNDNVITVPSQNEDM